MNQPIVTNQTGVVLNRIVNVEVGEAKFSAVTALQESRCGDETRQRQ